MKKEKTMEEIRKEFPALNQEINGNKLVYLDNAATNLKPKKVVEAMDEYNLKTTANIHRGIHTLSQRSTDKYEETRTKVKNLINSKSEKEIIFTKGTTNSINLVSYSFGSLLSEGDEIIISEMEHHSNIVPWQLLCERKNLTLKVIPIDDEGELDLNKYEELLNEKTKLVSIVQVSNSLGTINDVKKITKLAHNLGAKVLIDGAQALAHTKVDVQDIDCDFYAFSGHKMFGPTGVGVLYGKEELLNQMPPFEGGGDMIEKVSFEKTTYNELPFKFEAGTPPIAEVIGLGAAIDFISELGLETIKQKEEDLLDYGTKKLEEIPNLEIIGRSKNKAGILSFTVKDIHPHDIGSFCDQDGIAIRTGHHCTQPVMDRYDICATARASLSIFNTKEEIDKLVLSVKKAIEVLQNV